MAAPAAIRGLDVRSGCFSFRPHLPSNLASELLDVQQDARALAERSDCYEQDDDVDRRQGENHQTQRIVDVRAQETVFSKKHAPTCREVAAGNCNAG